MRIEKDYEKYCVRCKHFIPGEIATFRWGTRSIAPKCDNLRDCISGEPMECRTNRSTEKGCGLGAKYFEALPDGEKKKMYIYTDHDSRSKIDICIVVSFFIVGIMIIFCLSIF